MAPCFVALVRNGVGERSSGCGFLLVVLSLMCQQTALGGGGEEMDDSVEA